LCKFIKICILKIIGLSALIVCCIFYSACNRKQAQEDAIRAHFFKQWLRYPERYSDVLIDSIVILKEEMTSKREAIEALRDDLYKILDADGDTIHTIDEATFTNPTFRRGLNYVDSLAATLNKSDSIKKNYSHLYVHIVISSKILDVIKTDREFYLDENNQVLHMR